VNKPILKLASSRMGKIARSMLLVCMIALSEVTLWFYDGCS